MIKVQYQDGSIKAFEWEDAEAKHAFWHTSSHLMAEALQELYPGIQFGIGPAIENGFYYDVMPPEGVVINDTCFENPYKSGDLLITKTITHEDGSEPDEHDLGKEFTLNQGDSIYFNPTIPHGQRCGGNIPARFVTIIAE